MDDVVTKVGLPVVVALLTTLVIEYAAKPRLDARRERITHARRQVDEVVFGFQLAGMLAGVLASVPNARSSRWHSIVRQNLEELARTLSKLELDVSRLSVRYVQRHHDHISKTMRYLGYLHGTVIGALEEEDPDVAEIAAVTQAMDRFDTYFRVYVGAADSQEPLVKRLFWRRFTKREFAVEADRALEELGLRS